MKKNGFTLSELIISLTIIGVSSALMMPAITKLMPDKNKVKVNNIHSKIVGATSTIIDDDSIYWCKDDENMEGLSCDGQALGRFRGNQYSGDNKYENLMVYFLGLEPADNASGGFNWVTPDGVVWRFERGWSRNDGSFTNSNTNIHNTLAYRITVDLNGLLKNPNRLFGQNGEQRPDRFRFRVDNYGGVTPEDALTAVYLQNSFKSNDKKGDRQRAQTLLNQNARYRSF